MSNHIHTFCLAWLRRGEITGSTNLELQNDEANSDDGGEAPAQDANSGSEAELSDEESESNLLDDEKPGPSTSKEGEEELDSDDEIVKQFNLEDYDDEDEDEESKLKFDQLCQQSTLTDVKQLIDTTDKATRNLVDHEDEDNAEILPTDNLLVASRTDGDFNNLEIHVYNTDTGDFYCHHDIWIEQTPLSMEILRNSASVFSLVGLPDGSIEAWDLAVSNVASPDLKIEEAHEDAVLSIKILTVENDKNTYFVSTSVDKTLKIWKIPVVDLEDEEKDSEEKESYQVLQTIKDLKSPIQSMDINSDQSRIAFGTMSGSVRIHRLEGTSIPEKARKKFNFTSKVEGKEGQTEEVEKLRFLPNASKPGVEHEFIIAAGNKGTINIFTEKSGLLLSYRIHNDAVPALLPFANNTGLITCSSDGYLKVWQINVSSKEQPFKLIKRKRFGTGAIHCLAVNPENNFAIAVGGEKGGVQVWNMRKDEDILEKFGLLESEKNNANNNQSQEIPECSVDLDGGVGCEDEEKYLDGIMDDYLPTTKKAKK